MTPDRIKAARDLLAFHLEAGVDIAIGDEPVDRFAEPAVERPPPAANSAPREAARRERQAPATFSRPGAAADLPPRGKFPVSYPAGVGRGRRHGGPSGGPRRRDAR